MLGYLTSIDVLLHRHHSVIHTHTALLGHPPQTLLAFSAGHTGDWGPSVAGITTPCFLLLC
jgi:hypothetical protein